MRAGSLTFSLTSFLALSLFAYGSPAVADQTRDGLRAVCLDNAVVTYTSVRSSSGKMKHYRYLRSGDRRNPKVFDCRGVGVGPVDTLPDQRARAAVPMEASANCTDCAARAQAAAVPRIEIARGDARRIAESAACPAQPASAATCLTGIGCVLSGSAFHFIPQPIRPVIPQCRQAGATSNCVDNIAAGVGAALSELVKGIGYLASAGWNMLSSATTNFFSGRQVHRTDNAMSKILRVFQRMSRADLMKVITAPAKWLGDLLKGFIRSYFDMAKNAAACRKWSGIPLASTCVEPSPAWNCMSCAEKTQTVCALGGAVGSELVLAFFTGGAAGAVSAVSKSAKIAQIAARVGQIGEAAVGVKVAAAAAAAGRATIAVAARTASSVGSLFAQMDKVPGLKQFAHANEQAFLAGFNMVSGGAPLRVSVTAVNAGRIGQSLEAARTADGIASAAPVAAAADEFAPPQTPHHEALRNGAPEDRANAIVHDESRALNHCPGATR